MKLTKSQKEARRIWRNCQSRYNEMWNKILDDSWNAATHHAYEIGFICDIEQALKRKRK
jgi:hypothetical protein